MQADDKIRIRIGNHKTIGPHRDGRQSFGVSGDISLLQLVLLLDLEDFLVQFLDLGFQSGYFRFFIRPGNMGRWNAQNRRQYPVI